MYLTKMLWGKSPTIHAEIVMRILSTHQDLISLLLLSVDSYKEWRPIQIG